MKLKYKSLFDLTGKVAVVTGGSGILGRHFCQGLAEFGASVAVVDLMDSQSQELAGELREQGFQAQGFGCDVSDSQSVTETVSQICARFKKIDVLHNNAASKSKNVENFFKPFETFSLGDWRDVMSVNVDGMFLVAQAVGARMVAQGQGGSIIQTSSIYGIMGPDQRIYEGSQYQGRPINTPAIYSTSKAAVVGLTKYLATYWAPHRIRVNTLVPGGVESGQNEEFKKRYSNRVPLGRMARADEMVGALIYLASDASSYVTGECLVVDGGLNSW